MAVALLHNIVEPWQQPIMRRALAEVLLLAISGGALGCWVIFYNLSYSAESLAHALLPGLVIAALVGIPLLLGGAIGIVVAGVAVALAGRTPVIGRDAGVAVVVSTLFGLGALLALSSASPPGLAGILFGDILGVSDSDLVLAAVLALVVAVVLAVLHPRLMVVGFDRSSAQGLSIRPLIVDMALLVLLAVALLVAVQGLGNLLVVGVLIAPAATARQFARRMGTMMLASVAIAVLAGIVGLYLSYYGGVAAGASIAGAMVAAFLLATVARRAPQSAGI
jgi:ABC-type Mn2+/Zn2+ transport system permease subunit